MIVSSFSSVAFKSEISEFIEHHKWTILAVDTVSIAAAAAIGIAVLATNPAGWAVATVTVLGLVAIGATSSLLYNAGKRPMPTLAPNPIFPQKIKNFCHSLGIFVQANKTKFVLATGVGVLIRHFALNNTATTPISTENWGWLGLGTVVLAAGGIALAVFASRRSKQKQDEEIEESSSSTTATTTVSLQSLDPVNSSSSSSSTTTTTANPENPDQTNSLSSALPPPSQNTGSWNWGAIGKVALVTAGGIVAVAGGIVLAGSYPGGNNDLDDSRGSSNTANKQNPNNQSSSSSARAQQPNFNNNNSSSSSSSQLPDKKSNN